MWRGGAVAYGREVLRQGAFGKRAGKSPLYRREPFLAFRLADMSDKPIKAGVPVTSQPLKPDNEFGVVLFIDADVVRIAYSQSR